MAKWIELTTLDEWQETLEQSKQAPVLLFKHSTTCPVSANALNEYEQFMATQNDDSTRYALVKVIESRPVSNQIAEDLGVKHASPQIILIRNKEQGWNTSHWSITVEHISAVMN